MSYRWSLNSKEKFDCPSCNERGRFTRYANVKTGEWFGEETVGMCDRNSSCGYHYNPWEYFEDNPDMRDEYYADNDYSEPILEDNTFTTINLPDPSKYFGVFDDNLYHYLVSKLGEKKVQNAFKSYITLSKNDSTLFLQVDEQGKIRSGKLISYGYNGKRIKELHPVWLHKFFKIYNFKLKQCLFGEHLLLNNDKPVMLVESEKTAIVGSVVRPNYIWLATGGSNNLNKDILRPLRGRNVSIIPDLSLPDNKGKTTYEKWREKVIELQLELRFNYTFIKHYEEVCTYEQREAGWDFADFILNKTKDE